MFLVFSFHYHYQSYSSRLAFLHASEVIIFLIVTMMFTGEYREDSDNKTCSIRVKCISETTMTN